MLQCAVIRVLTQLIQFTGSRRLSHCVQGSRFPIPVSRPRTEPQFSSPALLLQQYEGWSMPRCYPDLLANPGTPGPHGDKAVISKAKPRPLRVGFYASVNFVLEVKCFGVWLVWFSVSD